MPVTPVFPADMHIALYTQIFPGMIQPLEFTGWQDESMARKNSCYIGAPLSPPATTYVKGPDAIKFLSDVTTHSYANFAVGRARHTVITDEDGLVIAHGVVIRTAEDVVKTYFLSPDLNYMATKGSWDIELEPHFGDRFLIQMAGPRCLELIEQATQENFHDLKFMGYRESSVDGMPVEVLRMGMGGTLSYEFHGAMNDARKIYSKLLEVGEPLGVRNIGWATYMAQHTESGFQQVEVHFISASAKDKDMPAFLHSIGLAGFHNTARFVGSSGPDINKRLRNPLELGFGKAVSFDHEFPGRAALQREVENPTRKTVTLTWNTEDLIDVFASYFQRGEEPYRFIDFPAERLAGAISHQDDVLDTDGNLVGYSSGRQYSLMSRDIFSLGVIDVDKVEMGTELHVLWGEPGTRQKLIRATVSKVPHLEMTMNWDYDVSNIPRLT